MGKTHFWYGVYGGGGGMIVLLLGAVMLATFSSHQAQARDPTPLCFEETGYCISGRIREFWEHHGGRYVFGFPITPLRAEEVEGGVYPVQWFERYRLELHAENPQPYDVLLGRLGATHVKLAIEAGIWSPRGPEHPKAGCLYFEQTALNVCGEILQAFRANGLDLDGQEGYTQEEHLALFGVPLTPPLAMADERGTRYIAQWFERARLELHPDHDPPYRVLLGLLGSELIAHHSSASSTGAGNIPSASSMVCQAVPESIQARIRPQPCISPGTILSVDLLGFSAGETIGFWVTSPDGRVHGSRHPLRIESERAFTDIPIDTARLPAGLWSIVFEGTKSRHQSIIYFQVR